MSLQIPVDPYMGNPIPSRKRILSSDPNAGEEIGGSPSKRVLSSDPNAGEEISEPYAVPQALLMGGLKGLGRMMSPVVNAVGLGSDYADAALSPDNSIESLGGSAAQTATMLAGGHALGVVGTGINAASKVARVALSPAGSGVIAGTSALASGHGLPGSIGEGILVGSGMKALGGLPGVLSRIRGVGNVAEREAAALALEKARYRGVTKKEFDLIKAQNEAIKIDGRGVRVKPIPPSKLTPDLPPEKIVTMRETAAAKDASKPSQTVADEFKARAERQKQHIADSYANKAAQEAKNVANGENLEAQLRASIKPKAIPAEASDVAARVKDRVESMNRQGMSRGQIQASLLEDILKRKEGFRPADVMRLVDMVLKEIK